MKGRTDLNSSRDENSNSLHDVINESFESANSIFEGRSDNRSRAVSLMISITLTRNI